MKYILMLLLGVGVLLFNAPTSSAQIGYVNANCSLGKGQTPTVNTWTVACTPHRAQNAIPLMVECHPTTGTITSFSVSAPGWTFSNLKFITDTANQRAAGLFAAIAPDTNPATFTVTANGAGNCSAFAMNLSGEVTGNDPTGGSTTFESPMAHVGTTGCNDPAAVVIPVSSSDLVWYGCVGSVTGVNAPWNLGATDQNGMLPADAAEFLVLTGGAGQSQPMAFNSANQVSIVMGVGIKPQVTAHTVSLTWVAPTTGCDPTSSPCTYNMYRGNAAGTEVGKAVNIPTTSYIDNNAQSGSVYYYEVSASNKNGESGKSNEIRVVIPNTAPPAPANLTVTAQ